MFLLPTWQDWSDTIQKRKHRETGKRLEMIIGNNNIIIATCKKKKKSTKNIQEGTNWKLEPQESKWPNPLKI